MEVAVIGLGAIGSAAARFLAADGHDVIAFERHRGGHDRGSSHGTSRIVRHAYPDPLLSGMMREAWPLWEELARDSGDPLLVACGCLYFGPDDHAEIADARRALERQGLPLEVLDAAAVGRRFPALRLEPHEIGILDHRAGFLRPETCVRANARLAVAAGARLLEDTPVAGLEPRGAGVRVRTEGGESFDVEAAVVAPGAWLERLVPSSSGQLTVTRQFTFHLSAPEGDARFDADRFPTWIDAATHHYGFPRDGAVAGVKLARHHPGPETDPDAPDGGEDEARAGALAYARRRLPALGPDVVLATPCLYTNTADTGFLLDWVPGVPGAWLAGGGSGHAFKFSVLLGRALADLVAGRARRTPGLDRLGLGRFAS